MSSILFITTANLSTNPRLVKEIETALSHHLKVSVICFQLTGWSEQLDLYWIENHPMVNIIKIPAGRKPVLKWLISSSIEFFFQSIYPFFKYQIKINAYASNKRSYLLCKNLKHINFLPIHLIVSHNLGALYPAWKLSKKLNIPFTFDVEDYHPGEYIKKDDLNEKRRREVLLKKLLPEAAFITYASPLIGSKISQLTEKDAIKHLLINNCFPLTDFSLTKNIPGKKEVHINSPIGTPVNFVWFSQNIAANRGLELVIPQLAKIKDKVHLHLIGNLYIDFNEKWIKPNTDFISTYPPMSQKELNQFICQFDIGLALEPGKDENNNIAISNKIWAYLQAGLYILATNTQAQALFIKEHEGHGLIFEINTMLTCENIKTEILSPVDEMLHIIINDIEKIRKSKYERFEKAKVFAWEGEQSKLLPVWDKLIE